jgi:hypothetical protein
MKNQTIKNSIFSLFSILLFISYQSLTAQCTISNLTIETGECIEANVYNFDFDFNVADNESELFDVYINGDYIESYNVNDLPITIEEFQGSSSGVDTFLVCMNDAENCCADMLIESPL